MIKQLVMSAAVVASLTALPAHAAGIAYISSASGYVLGGGGIATTAPWAGQRALSGFNGYGRIEWNGRCLTGRTGGQPLTWESCQGGPAQTWKLSKRQLNNEIGWCADVEGNRNGANVRVLAWRCEGSINQQWHSQWIMTVEEAATKIGGSAGTTLAQSAAKAKAGEKFSASTGTKVSGSDTARLIGLDSSTYVSDGKGNLISDRGGA